MLISAKNKVLLLVFFVLTVVAFVSYSFVINLNHKNRTNSVERVIDVLISKNIKEITNLGTLKLKNMLYGASNLSVVFKKKNKKVLFKKANKFFTIWKKMDYGLEKFIFRQKDGNIFLNIHNSNLKVDKSNISKMVLEVNKNKKRLIGFDIINSKIYYRLIYPIFIKKEYIGSVELAYAPTTFIKSLEYVFKYKNALALDKRVDNSHLTNNSEFLIGKNKNYIVQGINRELFKNINFEKTNEDINYKGVPYFINNSFKLLDFNDHMIGKLLFAVDATLNKKEDKQIKDKFFLYTYVALVIVLFVLYYSFTLYEKKLSDRNKMLEDANKSKSEFLANMSHEIRTPLNAILGFVSILKESEENKEKQEYLRIIDASSKTLMSTIGDILDFSKLETGKLEIEKINFNLKVEFENVVSLFDAKASEKDILLSLHVDEKLPKFIVSDMHKLKQITSNLISNALKFTDSKKKIDVVLTCDNKCLLVEVIDEGKGISEDKLEHIFEAFGQEDSSTTRKYGGTGLGLSISSLLAQLLGGGLSVESELGKGSRFYFDIPIEKGEEINDKSCCSLSATLKENIKLLLVEDNKSNQMFMKIILKKLNIKPDIANDGIEAVDMFKTNSYDIVLMDENMPNMNGIEATKLILEYEKETNLEHTPIVALTANALKGDRERFLEAGMDEYMTKPLDKDRLIQILQQMVSIKRV